MDFIKTQETLIKLLPLWQNKIARPLQGRKRIYRYGWVRRLRQMRRALPRQKHNRAKR